jgi:hypothetical protein
MTWDAHKDDEDAMRHAENGDNVYEACCECGEQRILVACESCVDAHGGDAERLERDLLVVQRERFDLAQLVGKAMVEMSCGPGYRLAEDVDHALIHEVRKLRLRAEQAERERDEARAEVARLRAELAEMTARATGHAYASAMAEGGEEIVHQELRRERADHAETREEVKRLRAVVDAARA